MHLRRDAARPTHIVRENGKPSRIRSVTLCGTIVWLDESFCFFAAVAPVEVWYRGSWGREGAYALARMRGVLPA